MDKGKPEEGPDIEGALRGWLEHELKDRRGRKGLFRALVDPRSFLLKSQWMESPGTRIPHWRDEPVRWFNYLRYSVS